jgi:hypothetical protein
LRSLITKRTTDTLSLSNGVDIEVRAASFRRLRGPTYVAVIADEAAFWTTDEWSSNPDREILDAVRPGLATTGGAPDPGVQPIRQAWRSVGKLQTEFRPRR